MSSRIRKTPQVHAKNTKNTIVFKISLKDGPTSQTLKTWMLLSTTLYGPRKHKKLTTPVRITPHVSPYDCGIAFFKDKTELIWCTSSKLHERSLNAAIPTLKPGDSFHFLLCFYTMNTQISTHYAASCCDERWQDFHLKNSYK